MVLTPSGDFLYVSVAGGQIGTNYGSILGFSVASGALQLLNPPLTSADGVNPNGLAIDPSGNYLYVANTQSDSISIFSIRSLGRVGREFRALRWTISIAIRLRCYWIPRGSISTWRIRDPATLRCIRLTPRLDCLRRLPPPPAPSLSPLKAVLVFWSRTRTEIIYLWGTRAPLREFRRLVSTAAI